MLGFCLSRFERQFISKTTTTTIHYVEFRFALNNRPCRKIDHGYLLVMINIKNVVIETTIQTICFQIRELSSGKDDDKLSFPLPVENMS